VRTLLRGVRLVDGTGAAPVDDAAVLIDGPNIVFAGPERNLPQTVGDAYVADLRGKTVLPGLINTHVHLSLNPYRPRREWTEFAVDETTNTLEGYKLARECLKWGVTTLGDLSASHHGFIKLARLIDSGELHGPRIVSVGRALVVTGGHSYSLGREVDGPDEVRKAVREEVKAGARQVKLMVEAGSLEGAFEHRRLEMSRAEIEAAVDTAHAFGRMVRAHAITGECVKAAVESGVDVIEHGYSLDAEAIEMLVERSVPLVPTIQVWKTALLNADKFTPAMLAWRRDVEREVASTLPRAIEAGVKIALGTDGGTQLNPAGEVVVELQSLVEYGMTPLAAIQAATQNAAEVLGLEDTGTLAVGKVADVLVVDGDPTSDITAIGQVHSVFRAGVQVYGRT